MKLNSIVIVILLPVLTGINFAVPAQNLRKLYPFPKGDKYGLVDSKRRLVADYIYDYISPFRDGVAVVGREQKYGLVNCQGREIVPARFDSLFYGSDGLYAARSNDSINVIDTLGKVKLNAWYRRIEYGGSGYFLLYKPVKKGMEYIRNTIRHYQLESRIGLDRDSVLFGDFIYGYYSERNPALNGLWFSGGEKFVNGKAKVAISKHTFYADTLGLITPRNPDRCDFCLMNIFIPDKYPSFVGGTEAFDKYMKENLKYPHDAEVKFHNAMVKVRMVIDATGQVVDTQVLKSLTPDFDSAVIGALIKMPKWNPAMYNGSPVCWYYNYTSFFNIVGL